MASGASISEDDSEGAHCCIWSDYRHGRYEGACGKYRSWISWSCHRFEGV